MHYRLCWLALELVLSLGSVEGLLRPPTHSPSFLKVSFRLIYLAIPSLMTYLEKNHGE